MTTTRKHVSLEELLAEVKKEKYNTVANPIEALEEATGIDATRLRVRMKGVLKEFPFDSLEWEKDFEKFLNSSRRKIDLREITMKLKGMSQQDYEKSIQERINQRANAEGKSPEEVQAELTKEQMERAISKKNKPNPQPGRKAGRPKKKSEVTTT